MPINHRHFVHVHGEGHVHEPFIPEFVAHEMVTNTPVRSGPWDLASTWANGLIPREGSHVLIDGQRITCRGEVRFDSLMAVNGGGLILDPNENV